MGVRERREAAQLSKVLLLFKVQQQVLAMS
jgi:hypothetical protein